MTATRIDAVSGWIATVIKNGLVLPGIGAGQVLEIESVGEAGACVTAKYRSSASGAVITGVPCADVWESRRWELVDTGAGSYALRNYVHRTMCIASADVAGAGGIVQAPCAPTDAKQQWTFKEQAGGAVSVINTASGKALVANSATTFGLTADTGAKAEKWKYRTVTKMVYDALPVGGYVSLRTAVGEKTLTGGGSQATVGAVTETSPLDLRQRSTFKVLVGLTDPGCFTLESVASPGKYLHLDIGGGIGVAKPAAGAEYRATWCTETAAQGTGITLTTATDSWRALRSHKNGLVYGGASWYAGVPNGDDTADYVPDTAWIVSTPLAPASVSAGQVLEIESAAQTGRCVTTKDRTPSAGAVIVAVGCTDTWQMRRWELVDTGAGSVALRNYVNRWMCLGSADAAGSGVVQVACDAADSRQRWTFGGLADGTWQISNVVSGKTLAAPNATTIGFSAPSAGMSTQWRIRNVTKMRYDLPAAGSLVSLQTAVGAKSLTAAPGSPQATVGAVSAGTALATRQASTFKLVQGLADPSCYSFESTSMPGQYLDLKGPAGGINLDAAATPDKKTTSTWCAQESEFGTGITFIAYNNSWRALRSYKNGGVYGGASWYAAFPEADDAANYIPDTAWTLGAPWVAAP